MNHIADQGVAADGEKDAGPAVQGAVVTADEALFADVNAVVSDGSALSRYGRF